MRKNKSNKYGEYIRKLRRKAGVTFEEITRKFGWSKGTLLMHEKNLSKPTDFELVIRYATYLGVPPEDMLQKLIVDHEEVILKVKPRDRGQVKKAAEMVMSWYPDAADGVSVAEGNNGRPARPKKKSAAASSSKKKTSRRT